MHLTFPRCKQWVLQRKARNAETCREASILSQRVSEVHDMSHEDRIQNVLLLTLRHLAGRVGFPFAWPRLVATTRRAWTSARSSVEKEEAGLWLAGSSGGECHWAAFLRPDLTSMHAHAIKLKHQTVFLDLRYVSCLRCLRCFCLEVCKPYRVWQCERVWGSPDFAMHFYYVT